MHITHEPHYPCACALTSVPFSSHQTSKCLYFRLEAHISSKLDITLTPYKLTLWDNNFFSARPKYCLNKPWAFPPIHLYLLESSFTAAIAKERQLRVAERSKKGFYSIKATIRESFNGLERSDEEIRSQNKPFEHKVGRYHCASQPFPTSKLPLYWKSFSITAGFGQLVSWGGFVCLFWITPPFPTSIPLVKYKQ